MQFIQFDYFVLFDEVQLDDFMRVARSNIDLK